MAKEFTDEERRLYADILGDEATAAPTERNEEPHVFRSKAKGKTDHMTIGHTAQVQLGLWRASPRLCIDIAASDQPPVFPPVNSTWKPDLFPGVAHAGSRDDELVMLTFDRKLDQQLAGLSYAELGRVMVALACDTAAAIMVDRSARTRKNNCLTPDHPCLNCRRYSSGGKWDKCKRTREWSPND